MHRTVTLFIFAALTVVFSCSENRQQPQSIGTLLGDSPKITGTSEYASTPYVTPGDRVYAVGLQNGDFEELGWHIKGEMGGIWDHPIKLMDGFDITLVSGGKSIKLTNADSFINYPFANLFTYKLPEENLSVKRWQFVPDGKEGLLVQVVIDNQSEEDRSINLQLTGHADLRPTWLGERTNMIDNKDISAYDGSSQAWIANDAENPWFVVYGTDRKPSSTGIADRAQSGMGISNRLTYELNLRKNEQTIVNFVIAGSYESKKAAVSTFTKIRDSYPELFKAKNERYRQLALQSKLTIPDKQLQQTFEWLKYNCDWLVQTVPGVGTGIVAGLPDYPWWFGVDSEYALKGYMAIGQQETALQTISLLDSLSRATNDNGRIIHEVSTNGAVFNKGNINETPQFISLIWEVYQWTGDKAFLKKHFLTVKKGLQWLMTEKDANKNLFPDGFGMMEIHGLNSEMIDVAAYTQRAFADASQIATVLEEHSLALVYADMALKLRKKINEEFWSEEFQSYADFIGTDEQALRLIDDAIVRADTLDKPWAVKELKQTRQSIIDNPSENMRPFVLHHNWVVNTPMEMEIAEPEKADKALRTAEKYVNPFGVFVTGIDRDESAGTDDGSFKGSKVFSYTGAVMTLPTGVQAVAEANYGHPDRSLNYIKRMTGTFSYALPGSMYEVSPDYGMFTQAWNIYGFAVPIVHQFFGINPKAADKKIVIRPMMPSEWDKASLENVIVADNKLSVTYQTVGESIKYSVEQTSNDWEIEVIVAGAENIKINLAEGDYSIKESAGQTSFITDKKTFTVEYIKR
ncbi:MAG: glycogen debranching protein [Cyclobacteriaceae bacterium]